MTTELFNWNDRVLNLLTAIRDNLNPAAPGEAAISLRLGEQLVSGTNPLPISDAGASLTVDGSVQVSNLPETQTVDGAVSIDNFPETQTVAGSVQISNLPETQTVDGAVSIDNFPETQTVAGSVTVSNLPSTSFLTYKNFGVLSSGVVQTGTATLFAVSCYNSKDCKRYFQLFDSASAPQTGETPIESYPIGAECELEKNLFWFGPRGRTFTNGLAWGFSMSAAVFAPAQAADHLTQIKYV